MKVLLSSTVLAIIVVIRSGLVVIRSRSNKVRRSNDGGDLRNCRIFCSFRPLTCASVRRNSIDLNSYRQHGNILYRLLYSERTSDQSVVSTSAIQCLEAGKTRLRNDLSCVHPLISVDRRRLIATSPMN